MQAGGHFSYFIVQLIALLEQSDCSIRVFLSEIPIMKFYVGVFRSMRAVTINCESKSWPGLKDTSVELGQLAVLFNDSFFFHHRLFTYYTRNYSSYCA